MFTNREYKFDTKNLLPIVHAIVIFFIPGLGIYKRKKENTQERKQELVQENTCFLARVLFCVDAFLYECVFAWTRACFLSCVLSFFLL